MNRWILLGFGIGANLLRPCVASDASSLLGIEVSDYYGNRLSGARIELRQVGAHLSVRDGERVDVKRGEVEFSVEVPGFSSSRGRISVDRPEQTLRVAMRLGMLENPQVPCSIIGEVHPYKRETRVRVMSLFGMDLIDVPIHQHGEFEVGNIECGTYLLVVMRESVCAAISIVKITDRKSRIRVPVRIDGSSCSAR